MTSTYHPGELAVQARAGVQTEAQALAKLIGSTLKPAAQDFLGSQRLAIATTVEPSGRVWASLLTGEPGFVQVVTEQTVKIHATAVSGDPLNENLQQSDKIGLLVIDLATRRRLRLNGKAQMLPDGSIFLQIQQAYFNCPKYIQLRQLDTHAIQPLNVPPSQRARELSSVQQQWIAKSDTFFIASFHPKSGADASHRGGNPGFVRVLDSSTLVFPDYAGNNMFNTLGNLCVNPLAGLLFIDFESGSTLQLTGKAQIIWDAERLREFAGAERLVEFKIDELMMLTGASSLHWQFIEYSPFNPL